MNKIIKSQKGMTLATVIVMIIIMLIIATVSIVAGNRLIVDSKEYKEEQELQSVKAAVSRKKAEVNMAGVLIPLGESYVGSIDPIIKSDSEGTVVANGWYLLDEEALQKLGISDASSRYIVNYEYEVALATKNSDYIEEYMAVEYLHDLIDTQTTSGTALSNKTSEGDGAKMVVNKEENEVFGEGWYLVKITDFPTEYSSYIKHSYLFQLERGEYEKVTSDFEGIDITLD